MNSRPFLLVTVFAALCGSISAAVRPAPLFVDGAILQRDVPVAVWGAASPAESVTVQFAGQSLETKADADGRWFVRLAALPASAEPRTLVIKGENTIEVRNVLVGEVWLCSGQSNMERQLGLRGGQKPIVNWQQEAAAADYPLIRMFTVKQGHSDTPLNTASGVWAVCSPANVVQFSAVGYFFGRDLYLKLGVPIGLIHSSWGGTPVEAWTSREALTALPAGNASLAVHAKSVAEYPARLERFKSDEPRLKSEYEAAATAAKAAGKPAPSAPTPPRDPKSDKNRPTCLFNAMINPLIPYTMRGVIWYQGESNNGNPAAYRTLFPAAIADWRARWGLGDFPFLFVQIAPFKNMTPDIREAQRHTLSVSPATAMVVTTDVGDAEDIHPTNKAPVGARLALAARALAYGEKIVWSGPLVRRAALDGSSAVLAFDHVGGGLVAKDGLLRGFEIAGADGKFVSATAAISGETIRVSAPSVSKPVAVRFGWSNVPDVNLFNAELLPASPFTIQIP